MLRRFEELHQLRFPLLAGLSRIVYWTGLGARWEDADLTQRQFGTLAAGNRRHHEGAQIIRTHDVRPGADAVRNCRSGCWLA